MTALALIGKMFVSAAFNVTYVYTAELFPTEVRHVAFGTCSTMGRIGAMAATFIGAQLVRYFLMFLTILGNLYPPIVDHNCSCRGTQ